MTVHLQARIDPIITPRGTRYAIIMESGTEITHDEDGKEFEWMVSASRFAYTYGIEIYNV